jgi:hypothetical protein
MLTVCEAGCEAACLTHGQHFSAPIIKGAIQFWGTVRECCKHPLTVPQN